MKQASLNVTLAALVCGLAAAQTNQAPVMKIGGPESIIHFSVKASVAIDGKFDKWDATMTFTSQDPTGGVLDINIDAASVDTGSGMKNGKLKSRDFFNVKDNPSITFHSTKVVQSGPGTFDITGTFTIRGVSKTETLRFTTNDIGKGVGVVDGTMAFDRKDYGMNGRIPFIKVADRVEVSAHLQAKRVSGPPLVAK